MLERISKFGVTQFGDREDVRERPDHSWEDHVRGPVANVDVVGLEGDDALK